MERIVPYEKRRNYLCQDFNRHRASALMALILIFGAGSGLFQRIANGINDNTLQLSNVDAAIYSLYFYKGLDVLYRILYAVTVFGLILTTAPCFLS